MTVPGMLPAVNFLTIGRSTKAAKKVIKIFIAKVCFLPEKYKTRVTTVAKTNGNTNEIMPVNTIKSMGSERWAKKKLGSAESTPYNGDKASPVRTKI